MLSRSRSCFQAALAAHRAASGACDAQGPPLAVWLAWLTRRLDAAPAAGPTGVAAVAAALRGSPLDPRAWRARSGGSPNGPSDDFELALCGELLEPLGGPGAAAALGEGWHQWLGANRAARSTQVCSHHGIHTKKHTHTLRENRETDF